MKSLIKVIVVFCIAQSVCCNTDEKSNIELEVNSTFAPLTESDLQYLTTTIAPLTKHLNSNVSIDGDVIVGAFYKIVQNCDKMEMKNLFEKIIKRSDANSVQDKFEEFQKECFDKEENNKIIENYNELSNFLKNCKIYIAKQVKKNSKK